jgi:flagellar biosynthesis protein FlhB
MTWDECLGSTAENPGRVAKLTCVPMIFGYVVDWLLLLSGTVAVIFVIMSGISYITSGGDQKKLDKAKHTLTYAVLGLFLIFMSFMIIRFIAYVTGANCITSFGFSC